MELVAGRLGIGLDYGRPQPLTGGSLSPAVLVAAASFVERCGAGVCRRRTLSRRFLGSQSIRGFVVSALGQQLCMHGVIRKVIRILRSMRSISLYRLYEASETDCIQGYDLCFPHDVIVFHALKSACALQTLRCGQMFQRLC